MSLSSCARLTCSRGLWLCCLAAGCATGSSGPDRIPCEVDLDCDRRSVCDVGEGYCVPLPDGGTDPGDDGGAASGGLCAACEANHDCEEPGALCLPSADGSGDRYCGRRCGQDEDECPEGWACLEVEDTDGDPAGSQCLPVNGDCTCTPDRDGANRPCVVEDEDGTCEGIQRCYGDTGWGYCQAPDPSPETCDGQDNDCDGAVDEDLALGTCGVGVCQAAEECVDAADGATVDCTPLEPTLERDTDCNDADDDCDGETDEDYIPFKCGMGVCESDSVCNAGGAVVCVAGQATLDFDTTCNELDEDCDGTSDEDYAPVLCGLGICVRPASCDEGVEVCVPGEPEADDAPELGFEDSNCDGIDGDIAGAVFVDWLTGDDANDGTIDAPFQTITTGLDAAELAGKDVYISEGTYPETLTLVEGVSLYGGYSAADAWSRSVGNAVEISGGATAVRGDQIDDPTELQLLTIRSADAVGFGASSYGLFLTRSEGVVLTYVTIRAGNGAAGQDGDDGTDGADADDGEDGEPGCEDSGIGCSDCSRPLGGPGGDSACGRIGGTGGGPGHECSCGDEGGTGEVGTNGGAPGCGCGGGDGDDGDPGIPGAPGTDGAGGQPFGSIGLAGYIASNGGGGTSGTSGNGGGGGGGGSGGDNNCDSYGSAGGGGGGGGCLGTLGTQGTGAGGSFAIFLWDSTVDLVDCELESGAGGMGGDGGAGGAGGTGGDPGDGGPYGGVDSQDDGGPGGAGGPGGDGGRGGHGGGGGGGPSIGVECGGTSTIGLEIGTDYSLGGAGAGGPSAGHSGSLGREVEQDGC